MGDPWLLDLSRSWTDHGGPWTGFTLDAAMLEWKFEDEIGFVLGAELARLKQCGTAGGILELRRLHKHNAQPRFFFSTGLFRHTHCPSRVGHTNPSCSAACWTVQISIMPITTDRKLKGGKLNTG